MSLNCTSCLIICELFCWDVDNEISLFRGCRLHREVEAFIDYISPTPVEDEIRSLIVALISRTIRKSFPDAEVLPFGSYETKLYLPQGFVKQLFSKIKYIFMRLQ